MVKLAVILILLVPSMASSACLQWILCGYIDEPNGSRRLNLPQGSQWEGIEVKGNQAAVCMLSVLTPAERAAAGCTPLAPGLLKTKMIPPFEPFLDTTTGKVVLKDGQGGRPALVRPFDKPAITNKFSDDPEFAEGFPEPEE